MRGAMIVLVLVALATTVNPYNQFISPVSSDVLESSEASTEYAGEMDNLYMCVECGEVVNARFYGMEIHSEQSGHYGFAKCV